MDTSALHLRVFGLLDEEFDFLFAEITSDLRVFRPRGRKKGKKKKKADGRYAVLRRYRSACERLSQTVGWSFQGQQPVAEEEARFDVLDGDGIIFLSPILSAAIISPSQRDDAC